jgi:hypothetical protein
MAELRLPSTVKTGPYSPPLWAPQPGIRSNNEYDQCLANDLADYDLAFDCGDLPRIGGCELPWVTMPSNGRRFRELSSLSISNPANVFDGVTVNPILQWLVPVGYDGVIDTIIANISGNGNGFNEGSGQIAWRLAANNRYLRDVGNLQFSIGSLITPIPDTNSGLRVYSGNIITMGASFSAAAQGAISGIVIAATYGWIYPR